MGVTLPAQAHTRQVTSAPASDLVDRALYHRKNPLMPRFFQVLYQGTTSVVPQDAEKKGRALAPAKAKTRTPPIRGLFPQPLQCRTGPRKGPGLQPLPGNPRRSRLQLQNGGSRGFQTEGAGGFKTEGAGGFKTEGGGGFKTEGDGGFKTEGAGGFKTEGGGGFNPRTKPRQRPGLQPRAFPISGRNGLNNHSRKPRVRARLQKPALSAVEGCRHRPKKTWASAPAVRSSSLPQPQKRPLRPQRHRPQRILLQQQSHPRRAARRYPPAQPPRTASARPAPQGSRPHRRRLQRPRPQRRLRPAGKQEGPNGVSEG